MLPMNRSVVAVDNSIVHILRNKRVSGALKVRKRLVLCQDSNDIPIDRDVAFEVKVVGVADELRGRSEDLAVRSKHRVSEEKWECEGRVGNGNGCGRGGTGVVVDEGEGDGGAVTLCWGRWGRESGGREGEDGCEDGLHLGVEFEEIGYWIGDDGIRDFLKL